MVLFEEKMCLLDKLNKLDILDALRTEIKDLKETINAMKFENEGLRNGHRDTGKETVTDLLYGSVSDNLIITGRTEIVGEDVEEQVKTFFKKGAQPLRGDGK